VQQVPSNLFQQLWGFNSKGNGKTFNFAFLVDVFALIEPTCQSFRPAVSGVLVDTCLGFDRHRTKYQESVNGNVVEICETVAETRRLTRANAY